MNLRGSPPNKKESLFSKIQWLMFYRAVVVTILLGATVLVQLRDAHFFRYSSLNYFYILIGITYFLTLVYSLLLPRVRNLRVSYGQIFGDVFFITLLIYFTGGIESIFSWVYILSIFSASIILYRRGGLILASAASILYGLILDLEFYEVLHPLGSHIAAAGSYKSSYVLYLIVVNMTAFYLVAFLSAYLSEQVRRKEEELKETLVDYGHLERLYKDIVQNVNSGLITVDKAGRITSLNRMAGDITGYRLEHIYQQGIGSLFPGFLSGSRSPGDAAEKGWERPGGLSRWEADFQTRTGANLRLGFSVSPLKDSSEQEVGSIIIFQDLTKLREMEEDLKRADRLAAIGSMAAGMAHEIRNPLASISGSIEILKEELGESQEQQQLMEIILREVERLNSLIGDFLLYARPAPRAKETIHLNGAIEDILKVFAKSPNCGPGVRIVTRFHDELVVPGDAQQMRQVFWNLFNNAAEAMPEGGELRVELRRLASPLPLTGDPNPCEVSVTDTGAGIGEEVVGKIFDPFFTTKEKGTGLGLSIVHSILSSNGGKIQVQSRLGQGTTFTLFFPSNT